MNWAVIMAGGRGTRFWPASRVKHPKPFLSLLSKKTLLEETVERLYPLFPPSRILIVLQGGLVKQAKRLVRRLPKENILGEPVGRNTAPCAVYAASQIGRKDPKAKIIFLPADQYIQPKSLFLKSLKIALDLADEKPVVFGIRPKWPNPSYGYLEVSRKKGTQQGISIFSVARFHEKPSLGKARQFLKKRNFFWNSGIFAWRLESFRKAVQRHLPKLSLAFTRLASANQPQRKLLQIYRKFPSVSLDYGIMEKLKGIHCVLAPFRWNDLGGWTGLAEFWPSDSHKNRVNVGARHAVPLLLRSRNNIVKGNKRLIALLGVNDMVIIDTPDALLICPRSRTEEIREVVRELERRKASNYL